MLIESSRYFSCCRFSCPVVAPFSRSSLLRAQDRVGRALPLLGWFGAFLAPRASTFVRVDRDVMDHQLRRALPQLQGVDLHSALSEHGPQPILKLRAVACLSRIIAWEHESQFSELRQLAGLLEHFRSARAPPVRHALIRGLYHHFGECARRPSAKIATTSAMRRAPARRAGARLLIFSMAAPNLGLTRYR